MSLLSADAVEALVDAAREGQLPADKPAPDKPRKRRASSIRVVDFRRTVKFRQP